MSCKRLAVPSRGRSSVLSRSCLAVGALVLAAWNVGCRPVETRFDVLSFRDAGEARRYTEVFDAGYFRLAPNGNWTFVFEVAPTRLPMTSPAQDGMAASRPADDPIDVRMSQTLKVEVFWRPRPGTTYAEATQTNARILYSLSVDRSSIAYEGSGFVWFTLSRDGNTVTGSIESSALYPARTVHEPPDLFGPCRLSGTFTAARDQAKVVALDRSIRKRFSRSSVAESGSESGSP